MPGNTQKLLSTINGALGDLSKQVDAVEQKGLDVILKNIKGLEYDSNNDLIQNTHNTKILGNMKRDLDVLLRSSSYTNAVKRFGKQYDIIGSIQNEWFESMVEDFKVSGAITTAKNTAVRTMVDNMVGGGVNQAVTERAGNLLLQHMQTGSSMRQVNESLREFMIGNKNIPGRLTAYTGQIATDSINQYSRAYAKQATEDLGFEWFQYVGRIKDTTRPFCKAMVKQRYIHKSEMGKAAQGILRIGKVSTQGMYPDMNKEKLIITAGGYRCNHQFRGVTENNVPKSEREKFKKGETTAEKVDEMGNEIGSTKESLSDFRSRSYNAFETFGERIERFTQSSMEQIGTEKVPSLQGAINDLTEQIELRKDLDKFDDARVLTEVRKNLKKFDQEFEPFRKIALKTNSADEFIKQARKIKGVSPEVAEAWRKIYSKNQWDDMKDAAQNFINDTRFLRTGLSDSDVLFIRKNSDYFNSLPAQIFSDDKKIKDAINQLKVKQSGFDLDSMNAKDIALNIERGNIDLQDIRNIDRSKRNAVMNERANHELMRIARMSDDKLDERLVSLKKNITKYERDISMGSNKSLEISKKLAPLKDELELILDEIKMRNDLLDIQELGLIQPKKYINDFNNIESLKKSYLKNKNSLKSAMDNLSDENKVVTDMANFNIHENIQGLNKAVEELTENEIGELLNAKDEIILFRGYGDKPEKFMKEFIDGESKFVPRGVHGNGFYFSGVKSDNIEDILRATGTAKNYSKTGRFGIAKLSKNAKVIDSVKLEKDYYKWRTNLLKTRDEIISLNENNPIFKETPKFELLDYLMTIDNEGSYALANGYDAIHVERMDYYVLLNRTSIKHSQNDYIYRDLDKLRFNYIVNNE